MIILGYHRVNPAPRGDLSVTTDTFRRQLLYLLNTGHHNVSLEEAADSWPHLPRHAFAITFDDGCRDNYIHAMPILRELQLKATVFVIVNYVDTDQLFPWDERRRAGWGGDLREEDFSLTWSHLREMQNSQLFTIGSHTLSHPNLTTIDTGVARHEVTASKLVLEGRLGRSIKIFCYPRGDVNREVIGMVQDAGYALGVVTPPRPIPRTRYTIHRVGVDPKHGGRQFALRVSPAFRAIQQVGIWPRMVEFRGRVRARRFT